MALLQTGALDEQLEDLVHEHLFDFAAVVDELHARGAGDFTPDQARERFAWLDEQQANAAEAVDAGTAHEPDGFAVQPMDAPTIVVPPPPPPSAGIAGAARVKSDDAVGAIVAEEWTFPRFVSTLNARYAAPTRDRPATGEGRSSPRCRTNTTADDLVRAGQSILARDGTSLCDLPWGRFPFLASRRTTT